MSASRFPRRRLLLAALCAPVIGSLAACGQESAASLDLKSGTDITGTNLGTALNMTDTSGTTRTLADFKGKVTVFFFGFTQCPDVCPTALAELAQTLEVLGDQAGQVQVVMISVDPERDTLPIMQQYVKTFNPDFIGLTGTPDQLAATAGSFKAYYAKVPTAKPGEYTMDHAASFYVFDRDAQARILLGGNSAAADMAADIRQLL